MDFSCVTQLANISSTMLNSSRVSRYPCLVLYLVEVWCFFIKYLYLYIYGVNLSQSSRCLDKPQELIEIKQRNLWSLLSMFCQSLGQQHVTFKKLEGFMFNLGIAIRYAITTRHLNWNCLCGLSWSQIKMYPYVCLFIVCAVFMEFKD